MRLKSLAAAIMLLALMHAWIVAEDKPAPKDDAFEESDATFGFSYKHSSLLKVDGRASYCVNVLEIGLDEDATSKIQIQYCFGFDDWNDKLEDCLDGVSALGEYPEPVKHDTTVAGIEATRVQVVGKEDDEPAARVVVVTHAEHEDPYWYFESECHGEKLEDQIKLVNAAIKSFKLLKAGDKPVARADFQFSTRLGYSIETAGFKGPVLKFGSGKLAESNYFKDFNGEKVALGTFNVAVKALGERAETRKSIEANIKSVGIKGFEIAELEKFGCKALSYRFELMQTHPATKKPSQVKVEHLLIWDGELTFKITYSYYAEDCKDNEAIFSDTLKSFELLKPAKAEPPK